MLLSSISSLKEMCEELVYNVSILVLIQVNKKCFCSFKWGLLSQQIFERGEEDVLSERKTKIPVKCLVRNAGFDPFPSIRTVPSITLIITNHFLRQFCVQC